MNSYDAGILVFEFSALGESKFCFEFNISYLHCFILDVFLFFFF
jgi:hypothetical protein